MKNEGQKKSSDWRRRGTDLTPALPIVACQRDLTAPHKHAESRQEASAIGTRACGPGRTTGRELRQREL